MDGTTRNNNRRLHRNSLPLIDLRFLSQTDLLALSASPQNDAVSLPNPKIDKSVFNESAGSRRQTFSRLRLAPPNAAFPPQRVLSQPLDEDTSEIASLLKSLFRDGQVGCNDGTDIGGFCSSATERGYEEEDAGTSGGDIKNNYETALAGFGAILPVPDLYRENPPSGDEERQSVVIAKRRGRPPKVRDGVFKCASAESNIGGKGNCEDPYQIELKRRTNGMSTEAELVEFLAEVGGEWASKKRKRKVVDAAKLGDWLPSGWRIKLCLMKRVSFFWLTCSCYISPDGQQFASYQEASSYLDSFSRLHDASQVEDEQNWHDGLWDSARLVASTTATNKTHTIPLSLDHEHSPKIMKYRCHKCTTSYDEPDDLLQHLFSSHQRKGPRLEMSMAEEGIVKNGNYECQFCNKMYKERQSFYGHLGMHIKDYVKRLSASGGAATIQKIIAPSAAGIPHDIMEIPKPFGADQSVAMTGSCMPNTSSVLYCESKRSVSAGIFGGNSAKSSDSYNLEVEMRNGVGRTSPCNDNVSTGDVLSSLDVGNGKDYSEMNYPKCTGHGYTNFGRNDITAPHFSLQSSKIDREGEISGFLAECDQGRLLESSYSTQNLKSRETGQGFDSSFWLE